MTPVARLFVPMLALVACSQSERLVSASADSAPAPTPTVASARLAKAEELAQVGMAQQAPVNRKVIYTAELRIELENVEGARQTADSIATALGGLVTGSRATDGDDRRREVAMTLRVPNARFAEAMSALKTLGRVRVDQASGDDVTRAYNDLEIRLAVKRDLVGRLRALVASRTAKLSDVLEVERELARAIAELEQMEGERRFLDNQIAMATINTTFFHLPVAGPGSVLQPLREAVRDGTRMLIRSTALLVSLMVFLTPWIVIAALGWFGWRSIRRRVPLTNT